MSCPTPALPALAALLASGGPALLPNGQIAPPETPKESKSWQQQQQDRAGKEDVLADAVADAVPIAQDRSSNGAPEAGAASPEQEAQQPQQQLQERQKEQQAANASSECHAPPSSEMPAASAPSVAPEASLAAPAGPTSLAPPRRGSDRSGEWHPLDAVVERIESHVRPGAGGQRLQWTKGFRMPLGAEGRQILLRRLRKAYHSNPMRWDEELARHRIVFSRMPYATVIELFHLAHLLGVFDFAVKCSEEYGSDAAGGATHRKRRPARTAAATAAAAAAVAAQQAAAVEGGVQAVAGAGEEGAPPATSRPTQGERKRNRRTPALHEGSEAPQLHSARPKRARRFSPAYLRDYETLAESFRLPPPPAKKGRSTGGHATSVATSANALLNWNCSGSGEVPQLQPQDDLLAAALGGRECASAHEALLRAVEEQAAAATAAAAAEEGATSSNASHPVGSLRQTEFNDKIWNWGGGHSEAADVGSHLALPEGALGGGPTGNLGSSLEGELRDLSFLLQQEQQCRTQREVDQSNCPMGRVFFSAELPGGVYREDEAGNEAAGEQRFRCSNSGRNGNNIANVMQHRRNRKTKTTAPASDAMSLSLATGAASHQPSLAELLVGEEVKNEGKTAGGTADAAAGASPGSQLNLHLLTTNYTIAAQYLQVIELLAVQRQIMELTQNLNKKRAGDAAATAVDAAVGREGMLAAADANPLSSKLDYQTLLNQQLILRLGAEAGLNTTAQHQAQQSGPSATATHASILKDLEKKVSALESLAAERSDASAHADGEAKSNTRPAVPAVESKCKRDLSRQSALSCSAPESPVDGYDSAAASPCCSGSSSLSACNTPDSLGGDRLLLLSSLWQPLPPAEGLAGAHL